MKILTFVVNWKLLNLVWKKKNFKEYNLTNIINMDVSKDNSVPEELCM